MNWWAHLYDDWLASALLERTDPGEVARTTAFLRQALELAPGSRVYDQCCGIGSLAIPLAQQGFAVVGVDQAAGYIARAQGEAAALGLTVALHAADACAFVVEPPCDAGCNWWTSFGYFPDDRDNLAMLQRAAESLRPGALFALDTMNLPAVLRGLQPDVVTRRQTPQGELLLWRRTSLDLAAGLMRKVWTFVLPDGTRLERPSAVRLHLPHQIAELLREAGFVDVRLLGDLDFAPLAADSPRCIALARRAP